LKIQKLVFGWIFLFEKFIEILAHYPENELLVLTFAVPKPIKK
jgi:hypothetical protein